MSNRVFTHFSPLGKIVTCIYLYGAALIFNITITIFISPSHTDLTPPVSWCQTSEQHPQQTTLHLLMMPNNDGDVTMNLKRWMVIRSHCLRSLAVHRSSKGTKTDTDNPDRSRRVALAYLHYDAAVISLHTRARSHMQVGVFALGLSLIVHIKYDKDTPSSARWSRKWRERG